MLLALDIGNSQILGGVFKEDKILFKFRKTSKGYTSDEFGIFFKSVLRENGITPKKISQIAICSVVPGLIYPLYQSAVKYFNIEPFIIQPGIKTGLNLKYKNPQEIGSDRIANAIGATKLFESKNTIIVDLGTATTFCIISAEKEYLGGIIMPGLKISMEALAMETAKLPKVEILKPENLVGKSTVEAIQSGLYFSHLLAMKGIVAKIKKEYFKETDITIIGTGGFSKIFENDKVFDYINPDLVLIGINAAIKMSENK
ncbi:MAG: type III pantothenate kinase [Elusimicrobia bacterium]|nr:type III pantothenate kinase [Elusimicrobiota bacterium]